MRRLLPLLALALAILAAAGLLAGSAWFGRAAAREARLETIRVKAREAVGEVGHRFDGTIDALLAREAARPFYLYQHLYSPPEALAAQFVLQPSPLLFTDDPLIDTWFEILPDGRLSLPQDDPAGTIDQAGHGLVAREALPELLARVHQAPRAVSSGTPTVAVNEAPPPAQASPAAERQAAQAPPRRVRPPRQAQTSNAAPDVEPEPPAVEPPVAPPVEPPAEPQVSQLPRWAVETNIRANEIAQQIEVANTGDMLTQQQLQSDFNTMRGIPQAQAGGPVPPAAPRTPPAAQADAGTAAPPDAGSVPPAAGGAAPSADAAGDAPPSETHTADASADRSRPPRRRDAVRADAGGEVSAAEAAGADAVPPVPAEPVVAVALPPAAAVAAADGTDEVSVVYGAFEPLRTADGVTYYARTVDIEGDVRVQGFRLSPGGLRAALDRVMRDVQRSQDAFTLVARAVVSGASAAALGSAAIDGVPEVARVAAILRPDSPTLAAEDDEDRRVVLILAGLSAVIAVAVVLAFLALRRELELARRKSDFLSAVSHELRAPVTTIRMYAEMLRDGWVDDAARRTEYETAIVSEGERLSRLVENVLAYSRRERGKPLAFREADLAEKVREVVGLERPVFERATLELQAEAPEQLPWRFDADAVTQILVNLLDNALKHSRDATERRVTVRVSGAPDAATMSVEDHGSGIPHDEQKRIFEPFYRVGSELTRETRGAGLGLALVRRLARAHGGEVTVSSEPGRGATFTVRLGHPA